MKKQLKITALVLTILVVNIGMNAETGGEQKIRQSVQAFYDAFNSHHFDNAANYTSEDWVHINPFGGVTQGRDATVKDLKEVHSTFLKGVTDTPEEISIRFATPEVAVVIVPSKMSGSYITPDGVKHENERPIRTFVLVNRNDKWLIMQDHNTFRVP